jgi:hypothetical protein
MRSIFRSNFSNPPIRLFDDPGDHNMNYCDCFESFSDVARGRRKNGEKNEKNLK